MVQQLARSYGTNTQAHKQTKKPPVTLVEYSTTYSLGLVISQFPCFLHHLFMPDITVRRKKDRQEEQQIPGIVK